MALECFPLSPLFCLFSEEKWELKCEEEKRKERGVEVKIPFYVLFHSNREHCKIKKERKHSSG